MENRELLNQIKDFFEKELKEQSNDSKIFADDVINLAYQKISAGLTDMIQAEEDPLVINEMLQQFLSTTKMVDERGLSKKQLLLKFFEQLSKYEQSKYY